MRELQGATYGGKDKVGGGGIEHLGGMFKEAGTVADISAAWEELQRSKRTSKARFSTVKVAGVGEVNVLNENDYEIGQEMPNQASGKSAGPRESGRQVAGRDFAHEQLCLVCWKGPAKPKACKKVGGADEPPSHSSFNGSNGGLRGCDLCPAAFHLSCIGMDEADASSFGTWSCPHHS